jgi:hypothetical protein
VRGRPPRQVGLDVDRAALSWQQQTAAAPPRELECQRGSRPDRGVELLFWDRSAGIEDHDGPRVSVRAQPPLEQTCPTG